MKRKVQLDQISEGLSSLGFSESLETFTDLLQPIFVGGMHLSPEDLIAHLDLVPPDDQSGEVTFEHLQQYIINLDESGRLFIVHCLSRESCMTLIIVLFCRKKEILNCIYHWQYSDPTIGVKKR